MARQYFRSLQAGRALAALAVVFHHATINMGLHLHPSLWRAGGIEELGSGFAFGVSYFFVLSGIVILTAHQRDIGCPAQIKRYAFRRFIRVYPVYWVVLAPFLVHFALAFTHPGVPIFSPSSFAVSLTLVQFEVARLILPVAWTLIHEVQFYILFGFAILHRKMGFALLAGWFAIAFVQWVMPFAGAPLDPWVTPLHLMFAAGLFCGWWIHSRQVPAPTLMLFVGACMMLVAMVETSLHGLRIGGYMVAGAGATLILLGGVGLEQKGRLHVPRALEFIAEASYSIYLVHGFVQEKLSPVLFRVLPGRGSSMLLALALLCTISTFWGILVHLFVEKPLLRTLRKWFESTADHVLTAA